jgi:hypothetical protein
MPIMRYAVSHWFSGGEVLLTVHAEDASDAEYRIVQAVSLFILLRAERAREVPCCCK